MNNKLKDTNLKDNETTLNNWEVNLETQLPQTYHCGGKQNAGKVLTVSNDGYIRLANGGGGGATYTGENGIKVDNTTHKISIDKDSTSTIEFNKVKFNGSMEFKANSTIDFGGAVIDFDGAEVTGMGMIQKTYSELKTMRDNSELVPGTFYRITDYVATTSQSNTQSANHPFDLIVMSITANELSENAYAIKHEGDTYFGNSTLTSWEILYCLDNDTNRFGWASASGKGVIYKLTDEYFNTAWYDFKGIQVKNTNSSDRFYYLFDNSGADSSLNTTSTAFPSVYGNKFGVYVSSNKMQIGCNVLKGTSIYSNTIGNEFRYNTIGNYFRSNTIGNNFNQNTIGDNFYYNTIGITFYNNTIGNQFLYNTIGNNFNQNTIGNQFSNNTIGNYFNSNNLSAISTQPKYCDFSSGINGLITTSTTSMDSYSTYYIASGTLKKLA